jgi:hypothetical protein
VNWLWPGGVPSCPPPVINVIGGGRPDSYGTPQIVRHCGESDAAWRRRVAAFFRTLSEARAD